MHLEILVEDSSGKKLLEILLPKMLATRAKQITFRLHSYKGVGRIPRGLTNATDAAKRQLLDQLPRLLSGYGKTPGIGAVIVLLDSDSRNCADFLAELKLLAIRAKAPESTIFRLAIEEIEAWYFGDPEALQKAYPSMKKKALSSYTQDSVCGTWERLADAIHPGGSADIAKKGWPLAGKLKHDWATKIGPLMNIESNNSPSFNKFRVGLDRIIGVETI